MMQENLFGEPTHDPERSQLFTPMWLARRMAAWVQPTARVLEPAAGGGNLVQALLEHGHPLDLITVNELDARWCAHLRDRFGATVLGALGFCSNVDFLNKTWSWHGIDVVLMNPPFEDNLHMEFVLRALELAPLVIGVFPAAFEYSEERDLGLWAPRARVVRRARLPKRVRYEGGGKSTDFDSVVLKIARREQPRPEIDSAVVVEEVWTP